MRFLVRRLGIIGTLVVRLPISREVALVDIQQFRPAGVSR